MKPSTSIEIKSIELKSTESPRLKFSRLVSGLLNRCPGCGRSATSFCARCWFILNHDECGHLAASLFDLDSSSFVSRALYIWRDNQAQSSKSSNIVRNAILASKGAANREVYRTFAEEMFRRSVAEDLWRERKDWVFIVPPSVRFSNRDHALELASQLSQLTGCSLLSQSVLEPGSKGANQQKTKSRKERELKQFSISRGLGPAAKKRLLEATGFLFLDDVIASGATAKAAWIALGKPPAFEAWAIAWRGLPGLGWLDRQ